MPSYSLYYYNEAYKLRYVLHRSIEFNFDHFVGFFLICRSSPNCYMVNFKSYSTADLIIEFLVSLHRPNDPRILVALGDTYHSLDKNEEAKKVLPCCYTFSVLMTQAVKNSMRAIVVHFLYPEPVSLHVFGILNPELPTFKPSQVLCSSARLYCTTNLSI